MLERYLRLAMLFWAPTPVSLFYISISTILSTRHC